ncbi:hypothetical protein [Zoogloea sp.]|uniref:hypothetical protein n=1 Tax=Zoogloea sp. TaxID=49181 RepID=UPI0035B0140E
MTDQRPENIACRQCHYFMATDHSLGTCHRYPPAFAGEQSPREEHRWRFPLVSGLSWCGEFALRE